MRKKILSVWGCLAAASAVAETPLLSEFVQGTAAESAPVRLEARMGSFVAGRVVTGKVTIPSPDGVSSKEWDTSSAANGWTEVTDGDEKASLLVLNPPGYAVEGGRITANTSWSANAVHWVRNWVVVPSGVTLTVKEGTIVKFGEQTGIKVEDGGTVDFQGKSDNRIVLTHFADDVYGGDSDFGKTNASYGAWSVTAVAGGTVNDTYTHVRYGKIESLPTISMPASVTAQRVEGKARIPVTLSGTRSNRMSLHWRTIDGTAKFGTDFSKNEDEAIWSNTSVETVYFEIPLIKTTDDAEVKTFRVEVLSTEDVNPNPERLVTTVTIISGTSVPIAKCVESGESMAIRLENREVDAVGRALVHGVEQKASDPNSAAVAWDTTKEPEGWQTLTAGESSAKVLVRNDAKVAIEGGRLTANTRWDSSAVHLVRNRVIVPAGVTLTIGEGAIVKFCEQTGIKVEDGGALVTEGKEKNRAVLTAIADDEFGGDSDLQESQPVNYSWSIETVGSGSVSDVYTYVRYGTVSTLPTISMPTSATAQRSDGKVRIPVTLSGTRSNRMSIHWRAVDGTAKFGVDYSEKEGEAYWANTSTTTVYFEIPIIKENESEEVKAFDVELISAEDINIDPLRLVTKVMIVSGSAVPVAKCAESEASAAVRLENRSAETVGRALVRGVELKAPAPTDAAATWDTTQEPEGWNTLMATSGEPPATAKVLVRNAADIAFEGGRLEASAKWTGDAVHIVRNMVVVPSGITLTVAEGTVVKFAEATGIKVEDGGKLSLEGKDKARSVLTSLADDEFGGDTDLVETNGVYGSWSVETVGSGEVSDVYTYIRYGTIAPLPTISMPVSATAQRMDGKVRIPVTFSGTRSNRVAIHWRTNDGTAKYGVDFPENAGEAVWANTSTTTVFLEIPLITESDADGVKTFEVEVVSAEDVNLDPSRLVTKVTIVTGSLVPMPTCAVSESSAAMRMEARSTNSLGRAAVVGTEWKAKDGESRAEEWDTTPLGYGWQTLEDGHGTNAQVLALNDAKIAVEGGRLTANVTWESNVVHVVRNTVVVPSGITLTVLTNAVVKFCENTGVKVEVGGSLIVIGSKDEPAIFTPLADDTAGGDTDKRETPVRHGKYVIDVVSGGTFADSFAAFRHIVVPAHATLSLPEKCEINESEKQVQIPVTLSGSRTTPFRAFWRVIDGTAKYPDDFPTRTGVVEWNSTSDGTRFITVPVNDDGVEEETENFTVELYDAQGANISASAYACVVTVRDSTATAVPYPTCAESPASEAIRLDSRSEGMLGKAVVKGVEYRAAGTDVAATAWDTTAEPEGWQTLTASDVPALTAQVLVRNDAKIAVEGGRLTVSTVWDSNLVHLVRHTVVVPSGVTLSVTTNAVVKFCENTGVKVEAGGRFQLLGSLDENVYMTLANDDTVGGDTDKDEEREWVEGAATYSVDVVSGGTFTDMNSVIRGTTIGSFGYASVNAKTVVDATEGVIRIPVFVNGSRTTQFSVDWKTSDGLRGQLIWGNVNEGTKWVTLNVADCSEKFTFELCECRGINIDGAAKVSEVTVFNNATPLAVCAESESSAAVRFENRADSTFGKALCFGTEWKSADGDSRAEQWDTTQEENDWIDLGEGMKLLVRNDADLAVEGGRLMPTYDVVNTNGVEVTNWNYSVNWTSEKVHIVRNWVVVPSGMTLSIAAGTVVKFAEFTGFKVEAGGRLYVEGTVDAPVVYTAAADDTIGGDTDKREVEPQYGDYSMNVISGGTYSDRNCAIRYATFSNLGTATLPASAVANEKDGVVRVPMFISTSRTTAFCVDWRVVSGTYATKGRLNWNTYTEGTKYIEIPLTPGTVKGEFDTFEIEMYESQGINVSTTERKCVVTIYPDKIFPEKIAFADSAESAAVRMENRDPLWSYGAEIVCGTELKSANGESRAEPWDTTQENDGWVEVTDGSEKLQLLVRNDEAVAVEGGRLVPSYETYMTNGVEVTNWNYSVRWTKDKVHIVRNWVVVPNGVTLTIAAGTVVKFCDETGIKVEAGGRLNCAGTTAADVILTSINDDTVGGDTDFDDVEPEHGDYWINVISGGAFTDTYTQMRYGESGTFGSVSIASDVVAKKDGGIVRIPLTISASRTTPFSVDWVAHDGTAIYGEDYLCASGRIDWTSSSQGTKYLEIPLDRMAPTTEDEWFEVQLVTGLGINLNLNATLCEVELYDTKDTLIGDNNGYAESAWATPIEVDGLAGSTYPLFAQPEEIISYSTLWQTNGVDGASVKVTYEDMEGNVYEFLNEAGPVEGQAKWKVGDDAYGRYRFRHQVLDEDGKQFEIQSQDFIVSEVIEHGGAVCADETWDAGHVHVVRETVTVLRGATLTIEPGAIVKFFPGTGITTQDDGECIANGAQFTHVADDQLGGDTFFDGGVTLPGIGEYTLSGNVRTDVGTETRYAKAQVVSANISADTTWGSHTVYHITKSITVTKPAVLTIQAGAVVKLADGVRITVNNGATLDVQGSRSAPVVFTSIKDDEFGGDSNQDGSATAPKNGIWDEILNSGTLRMSYAHVLYGGYGQYSNQGDAAIRNTGGTATLDGCVVEGSDLRLLGLSGGTMTVRNSVLRDGRWGWEGNVTFINGVVENCTTGASGGKATNTIFWNCPTAMNGTTLKNCVAFECDGGVGTATVADPKFVDGPAGDYRIGRDSPCVDAGDDEGAPEADYYGQSRAGAPDIGLYEVQLRETKVDVDLAAVSVSAAEKASIGGNLTVTWSVRNVGSMAVADAWRDKLELIDVNGATVVLGTYTVTGGISADGTRVFTGNFRVPSMSPGAARLRLKVNAERDVFEGSQTDNNVISAENTVQIALPSYTSDDYSKLTLASGTSMALSVAPEDGITALIIRGGADVSVFGAAGYVPAGLRYDVAAVRLADGSLLLSIPSSAAEGDFMFTVENGGASSATVEIETLTDALSISEITPMRASNTGDAYVTIRGVGLESAVSVRLEGSSTCSAQDLQAGSSSELTAQFNLNGASVGTYSVVVETEDGTTARIGGFEIYKPKMGPKLEARLEIPGTVRQGRIYTGKIVYSNVGDEDMYAPCFRVEASEASLRIDESDEFSKKVLQVVGISKERPAGILHPERESDVSFEFLAGASPRFKLSVEDDSSALWQQISSKLSGAATTLNARGREVFDTLTLNLYSELCETNPAVRAICGVVISSAGDPIVGAVVSAELAGEVVSVDTSDCNGRFVLSGLTSGAYYDVVLLSDYSVRYENVFVGKTDVVDFVIEHENARVLACKVLNIPDYCSNCVVTAHHIEDEKGGAVPDVSALIDDTGFAKLKFTADGCYSISVRASQQLLAVTYATINANDNEDITICCDGGTVIKGFVRTPSDEPLQNFPLWLIRDGVVKSETISNESGFFFFTRVQSGECEIAVDSTISSMDEGGLRLTVDEGCSQDVVVYVTLKQVNMSGTVSGECKDCQVIAVNDETHEVSATRIVDGEYQFSLPNGRYTISIKDFLGRTLTEKKKATITDGSAVSFDFSIQGLCPLRGCVFEDSGLPVSNAMVTVESSNGDLYFCNADNDGNYNLEVLPGEYHLTVEAIPFVRAISNVVVETQTSVDFQLCKGKIAYGCVPQGILCAFVLIYKDSEIVDISFVDDEGRFKTGALEDGMYAIRFGTDEVEYSATVVVENFENEISEWCGQPVLKSAQGLMLANLSHSNVKENLLPVEGMILTASAGSSDAIYIDKRFWTSLTDREEDFNRMMEWAEKYLYRSPPDWPCSHNKKTYDDYIKARKQFLYAAQQAKYMLEILYHSKIALRWQVVDTSIKHLPGVQDGYAIVEMSKLLGDILVNGYEEIKEFLKDPDVEKLAKKIFGLVEAIAKATVSLNEIARETIAVISNSKNHELASILKEIPAAADGKTAEQFLRKAIEIEPGNVALRFRLKKLQEAERQVEKLTAELDNLRSSAMKLKDSKFAKVLSVLNKILIVLDAREFQNEMFEIDDGYTELQRLEGVYDGGESKDMGNAFQALIHAYKKPYHYCGEDVVFELRVVYNNNASEIAPYVPPSRDPNEVAGPLGVGENRYVKPGAWMDYTVYFENASDAEAAALDIYVTNPLSEWLDWSTFEMGDVSFNNQIDSNLRGAKTKSNEVPQNGTTYYVNSSVVFDEKKGIVNVEMHIVDHTTKYGVPEDPYAGILPPNDETHCGEGYFSYRVRVREDAPANARIENSATIVFDYNPPIETDPAWWNTVYAGGEAEFDAEELKVDEGGTLKVVVSGGNMETASSVQVAVQYNTAAAADLDLKNATVNGAKPSKPLAFPVTLSWKAGEIGEKTVEIPVKKDTAVENDEFLTLQLSKPSGLELGEASVCTVRIHDPGYDALKAKVEGETATKKEKDAWTKLQKAQLPYVRSLAEPAHMGKVSGYGKFARGKKVTLKATASKGYAFAGWYLGDELVTKSASYSFKMTDEDADYRARFVTLAEDKASIGATVNGMAFGAAAGDGGSTGGSTNAMCGVALFWPLSHEALSATSVKVTGLPKGLKYDTKKKAITGVPTVPGKTSSVKVVVTTAGKQKATFVLKVTVDPLPEWAKGQFGGEIRTRASLTSGEDTASPLTMTVGSTGKVSGKFKDGITNWTFSASSFATNSVTVGETNLFCRATAKGTYKNAKKKTVTVSAPIAFELVALPDVSPIAAEGLGDFADGTDNVEIRRLAGARISVGEAGGGTVKMDKSYGQVAANKTVKLTATVKKGYAFLGWYDLATGDTEPVSQATSYALVSDGVTDRFLEARFVKESELSADDITLDWNAPTDIYVGVSYSAKPTVRGRAAVKIASVSGLPKGLSWKSGKVSGVPTTVQEKSVSVKVALTTNSKKYWTFKVPIKVKSLPEWAVGTFVGGMAEGAVSNQVTVTVTKAGKVSGKLYDASGTWTLSASSLAAYVPAADGTPEAFTAKVTGKNGKKSRTFEIMVTENGMVGFLTSGQESASPLFAAWRNVWKTDLAAEAAELALREDLQVADDLVLRFGANGAVTGVLTVGRDTFTCTATLVPESEGYRAYLYFAPNTKKKFKGEVRVAECGI